jgi:hypothetical protein
VLLENVPEIGSSVISVQKEYGISMTVNESSSPKKKKFKKWQIIVIGLLVLSVIGAIFGEDSSTTTPAPTPEVSAEPELAFTYSAEVTRWEPLNPASGRAVFTIRNTGEVSFIPESCTVSVQDDSYTYKGYDYISGFTETIKPGGKFMGNVVLTVTKEGAFFVTNGEVECDLKAVP